MKMKRHSILAVLMLGLITTSGCATHHCSGDKVSVYAGGCISRSILHTGSQPTAQTAHRPYQHPQGGVSARHDGRNGRR